MKTKHTCGPWKVEFSASNDFRISQPNLCWIADVYGGEDPEANARLIAAAPELLKACKLAKKIFEERLDQTHDMKLIYDAIAKAEEGDE